MNLRHYYYYFTSALSHKLCDDIIEFGNSQRKEVAITGDFQNKGPIVSSKELKKLHKTRDSTIGWLDEPWISREINPYVEIANQSAGWNFNLTGHEKFQFTKYALNQHYDWHCDSWAEPYDLPDNPNQHGKIRKISMGCSLSDPKDYSGGDLLFQFRQGTKPGLTVKCAEGLPRGSLIFFPSFVWHKVAPVIEGVRYSLVRWNLGPKYI